MPRSTLLALAATLLLAAGCGDDAPKSPQDVARAFVETNAASKCRLLTREYLERTTEQRGAAALQACERNVQRVGAPGRVTLKEYEVEPGDAEVELLADDDEAKVKLVKQDGRWLISGFEAG